jgi:hypothetical protein
LQTFQASKQTDEDMAKLTNSAAMKALTYGDYSDAKAYQDLAKAAQDRVKEGVELKAKDMGVKLNSLSDAASDYAAVPTPEAAQVVVERAIAAGKTNIPLRTQDPVAFDTWVKTQQGEGSIGEKKMENAAKIREIEENRAARIEAARQADETKRENARLAAMSRENQQLIESKKLAEEKRFHDLEAEHWAAADARKAGGAGQTAVQKNIAAKVGTAVGLTEMELANIKNFDVNQTSGVFSGYSGSTIAEKVMAAGARGLTTAQEAMLHSSFANLARIQTAMESTALGTRGGGQYSVEKLQQDVESVAGKDPLASLYSIALMAQTARNVYKHAPKMPEGTDERKANDESVALLAKYPSPEEIEQAALKDPRRSERLAAVRQSVGTALGKFRADQVPDKAAAADAEKAAYRADLLNKY